MVRPDYEELLKMAVRQVNVDAGVNVIALWQPCLS
jgi:hypothetical protein